MLCWYQIRLCYGVLADLVFFPKQCALNIKTKLKHDDSCKSGYNNSKREFFKTCLRFYLESTTHILQMKIHHNVLLSQPLISSVSVLSAIYTIIIALQRGFQGVPHYISLWGQLSNHCLSPSIIDILIRPWTKRSSGVYFNIELSLIDLNWSSVKRGKTFF